MRSDGGRVKGTYISTDRKVFWIWNNGNESQAYFNILVLDTVLNAFFKYSIAPRETLPLFFISSVFSLPETIISVIDQNVIDTSGNFVKEEATGYQVISSGTASTVLELSFKVIAVATDSIVYDSYIAEMSNADLIDWQETVAAEDYEATLVTGTDIQDDIARYKQAPILQTAFTRTERRYEDNGQGGVDFDDPSSCQTWISQTLVSLVKRRKSKKSIVSVDLSFTATLEKYLTMDWRLPHLVLRFEDVVEHSTLISDLLQGRTVSY
jgi:hypothetical protein